ncbi:hypothetical protein BGZ95_009373 [Linnemannia exigua]|uniref:Uncharacterized protein n=1 Tax=Linnemannia exigua TaxID=604196 RepID=A0AAD4DKP1_9FUNG|nr:hypothetical protein BGZ95_009373 [Linnemannia exigua]
MPTASSTNNSSAATSQPTTPATPTQSSFAGQTTPLFSLTAAMPNRSNRNSADGVDQVAALPRSNININTNNNINTTNNSDSNNGSSTTTTDATTTLVTKELEALESATLQIWAKLSKKLSFVHRPGKYFEVSAVNDVPGGAVGPKFRDHDYHDDNHYHHSHHGLHHGSTTTTTNVGSDLKNQWKMFSKSVQKSMANDKVEDTTPYTDSVLRLFQSATILEQIFRHYSALSAAIPATPTTPSTLTAAAAFTSSAAASPSSPQVQYTQIIYRLRRIGDFLNLVICAFVVRDLGEFLAKYNKRVSAWIAD